MNELNPASVYELARLAYEAKTQDEDSLARQLRTFPHLKLKTNSTRILTGTAGFKSSTLSGFGFWVELGGARQGEVVLTTRGTMTSWSDIETDMDFPCVLGPTGHPVHQGFQNTFQSYVNQVQQLVEQCGRAFRPKVIHCVGHSLGGALANLNAAAFNALGLTTYLYSLAAPRVGRWAYAEHLSNTLHEARVKRVANQSDIVTMVPCFPFMHAPHSHGHILLDGSMFKISINQHRLGVGYSSMKNRSWDQLIRDTRGKQDKLKQKLNKALTDGDGFLSGLSQYTGAMYSADLLNVLSNALHLLMKRAGVGGLISVEYFGTGAFTTLDQIAEILSQYARGAVKAGEQVMLWLNGVMAFLGRMGQKVADASIGTIRYVFNLLCNALEQLAKQAVQKAE
ncbi:lipase family protein [Limnobacter humi]|uniref:Lipase family protein n=1 Tax=Limnobacter humi TaxID=1778671 RepID=A0ABT1WDK0_9BURK|nr:lipase family protein [Limnobacter humi]MCQ8895454.1 lipase family protein [Limnobacter humi]